jgi:hypothetical protein
VVVHADEIQVWLLGQVRRRWGRCGIRIRQRVQRSRKYRSLFVAVDVRTGRLWHQWMDSMQGEEFIGLVRAAEQTTAIGAIVWDGAPGHTDHRVARIGIPLIALPPYSPELNPPERLFEAIRAETEGEVYTDLAAKCARVDAILARWDAHPEQVHSLAGYPWILDALEQLPDRMMA